MELVPNYPFWTVYSPLLAYVSRLDILYHVGKFRGFYIFHEGELVMFYERGSSIKAGKNLLKKRNSEMLISQILDQVEVLSKELIADSKVLHRLKIENVTKIKLPRLFKKLCKLHDNLWYRGQAINLLEHGHSLLGERLKRQLRTNKVKAQDIAEVTQALTAQERYSNLQKEEQEIINLALKGSGERSLKSHYQKYAWLGYNWSGPAYNIEYFKERVRLLRKDPNLNRYLLKDEGVYRQEVVKKKRQVAKKYMLSEDTMRLARTLDRIAYLKGLRVDASWLFYWACESIFRKLGKEHYLSLRQVQFLTPKEILNLLSGRLIDPELPNQRYKSLALHFQNGRLKEYKSETALEYLKHLESSVAIKNKVNILKGDVGCPGLASGVVKVVNKTEDISKMRKGDVLVSHTTNPRLVTAMKMAVAIIADVGGATSHAAIISRELGTPCIIGTKVATQVLRDGDLVEVDANKGVVRVIRRVSK